MGRTLTFSWVEQFIANRFPDPEPELFCVRAYRAICSLLFSAALLGTVEPRRLQEFTGYHPAFIAGVAWNMTNNRLWTRSGYDTSGWLSSDGKMDDGQFVDEVDVALGTVWSPDAEFSGRCDQHLPYLSGCECHRSDSRQGPEAALLSFRSLPAKEERSGQKWNLSGRVL